MSPTVFLISVWRKHVPFSFHPRCHFISRSIFSSNQPWRRGKNTHDFGELNNYLTQVQVFSTLIERGSSELALCETQFESFWWIIVLGVPKLRITFILKVFWIPFTCSIGRFLWTCPIWIWKFGHCFAIMILNWANL